jgi:hypothetical protein
MNRCSLLGVALAATVTLGVVGCSGGGDSGSESGSGQAETAGTAKTKSGGVIKYGVSIKGTFLSKSDVKTFTFVSQKGWNLNVMLRSEACGAPIPGTPACKAAFAPHLVIAQSGKSVVDVTGDMDNGDAIKGFKIPNDGTYTVTASVADWDGKSPLSYLLELDPPDLSCKVTADCDVHISGKDIATGLDCVQSDFPDEDGTDPFCSVPGEGTHHYKGK